jgi:hypothetical protein
MARDVGGGPQNGAGNVLRKHLSMLQLYARECERKKKMFVLVACHSYYPPIYLLRFQEGHVKNQNIKKTVFLISCKLQEADDYKIKSLSIINIVFIYLKFLLIQFSSFIRL